MNAPADWERLWAPHRMPYLQGENRSVKCVFCEAPKPGHDDLVVFKGETVFVVMNLYPYNSGHLLICPYRHVADLTDLTPAESAEIVALTAHSMKVLRKVSKAAGFNIGINQGALSGAGIADHLHQHLVPRWSGDTNFMPIIGSTKILAQLLTELRDLLASSWNEVS
ncbi:MAG: HIT family hydrolase [actinobacterium acAMD-5]|nr:MAG: HIT family hydrolase [actinobacterium acAMD-5]